MRILISSETDDQVGVELVGAIDTAELLLYDPTSPRLTPEQRAGEVLIPPYRGSRRDTLAGKRVLILGAGSIGTAVAAKLAAFDATPTLVGRRPRHGVHSADELPALAGQHDVVVVAAPLTSATRRLVDARVLAALPDGAVLVNAGRGEIVDIGALLAEAATGRIRAALDVTDPEPLPGTRSGLVPE